MGRSAVAMVWAAIVGTILLLIIYGMVTTRLRDRKVRRLSRRLLPDVQDHITADKTYRIVLTSGTVFADVRFL
jgi:hypothetical protein